MTLSFQLFSSLRMISSDCLLSPFRQWCPVLTNRQHRMTRVCSNVKSREALGGDQRDFVKDVLHTHHWNIYRYISCTAATAPATFFWSHNEEWHPAKRSRPSHRGPRDGRRRPREAGLSRCYSMSQPVSLVIYNGGAGTKLHLIGE